MTPPVGYTENELVEQPAIELFAQLGWETYNNKTTGALRKH